MEYNLDFEDKRENVIWGIKENRNLSKGGVIYNRLWRNILVIFLLIVICIIDILWKLKLIIINKKMLVVFDFCLWYFVVSEIFDIDSIII